VEVEFYDGWGLVVLQFTSTDPTIGAGGTVSFTITDASVFEIGKCYDLNLEEVPE
jgi:hypothetical protein